MPYSTVVGVFPPNHLNPSPVIEILIDGQPWNQPGDTHFRFGNRKCRMLLGCKHILQLFIGTNGENPEQHNQTVPPSPWLIHTPILIQGFPNFITNNHNALISHPYLKFSCAQAGDIGIGLHKANGLLSVWDDLENFATGVGMPPIGVPANIQDVFL